MKNLITYIVLIICISANAQGSDKVNDIDKQLIEVQTQWRSDVDASIRHLRSEVNNLKKEIADLKESNTVKSNLDLNALASDLGVTIFLFEDLPKDLKPDEIGLAFVKDNNDNVYLAISINNNWQKLNL